MWNALQSRVTVPWCLAMAGLAVGAGGVGAQSQAEPVGGTGAASVEVRCRLEMPDLCIVREVRFARVRHLRDGVHEVSFDVVVGSNTPWTLMVKPRPATSTDEPPQLEVRNEQGAWVTVSPSSLPVTIVSGQPVANRRAERVVFRIRAQDHLAALQFVQFDVLPTNPE